MLNQPSASEPTQQMVIVIGLDSLEETGLRKLLDIKYQP